MSDSDNDKICYDFDYIVLTGSINDAQTGPPYILAWS